MTDENFINVNSLEELNEAVKLMRHNGFHIERIQNVFPNIPTWLIQELAECYEPVYGDERERSRLDLLVMTMTPGSVGFRQANALGAVIEVDDYTQWDRHQELWKDDVPDIVKELLATAKL